MELNYEELRYLVIEDCDPRGDRDYSISDEQIMECFNSLSQEEQEKLNDLVRRETRWLGDESSDSFSDLYSN